MKKKKLAYLPAIGGVIISSTIIADTLYSKRNENFDEVSKSKNVETKKKVAIKEDWSNNDKDNFLI